MDRAASAIRFLQLEPPALARRPLLALRGSAPHTPASKHLFILQGPPFFARGTLKGGAVIFLSAHRKGYLENSAGVPVVSADRPFMQVNDLLRQGKADAGFSAFAHVKTVEDVGKVFLGDAVPVILYPDGHMPFLRAAGQVQLAVGIPQSVGLIFVTALRICVSSHLTMTGSSGKSGTIVMPLAAAVGSTARMLS